MNNRIKLMVIFIAAFMFLSVDLFAYLDPGSGSFILQMLIAGIASGLLALKVFWKKLGDFFKGLSKKDKKEDKKDKDA